MNMKIIINKPEIRSYDGICRLEAEIEFPEVTKTVFFSFPEEYMDGLCDENADATEIPCDDGNVQCIFFFLPMLTHEICLYRTGRKPPSFQSLCL